MKEQCDICGEIKAVHMKDEEGNSICPDCYNIVQSLESPACVYAIQRIDTKKVYIGSTVDLINRYGSTEKPHISGIRNPILHDEIKSMGWEGNFELIILETFDKTSPNYSKAKLLQAESKWLNEYGGCESDKTYNQRDSIITDKIPKKRKIKANKQINIQVSRATHKLLKDLGKKGQSFEEVLLQYLPVYCAYGTDDSYESGVYPLRTPDEIILFIRDKRMESEYNYNQYSGGKINSRQAVINCHRPGFLYHNQIKLVFISEAQCRAFEKRIQGMFKEENFTPRVYTDDW